MELKQKFLSQVKLESYRGVKSFSEEMNIFYSNEQQIIIKIIKYLEKYRSDFNDQKLNYYID